MKEKQFRKNIKLIGKLGSAFHRYGTNAERLEGTLRHITESMGLKGNFFSTPTYLTISIDSGEDQITRHIRSLPSDVNLEKLQDLDLIANAVINKKIRNVEAIKMLDELEEKPGPYNSLSVFLAFTITSFALSIIFGGGIKESLISLTVGSIVGMLTVVKSNSDYLSESFEFLSAFLVTIVSAIFYHYVTFFNFQNVIISSLIVIIPGIGVTIAMNELASQNLVSGTARLMGALIGLLKISFGIFIGAQTNLLIFDKIEYVKINSISPFFIIPAMLLTSITFTIIFNAKKNHYPWVLISGIVTFGSLKLSNMIFDDIISIFIASLLIGLFSNLFSRLMDRPSLITLLPGIIFLVPGSVGIKGLNFLFDKNVIAGLESSIQMFILSITIVSGLLIANIFLSPRKGL